MENGISLYQGLTIMVTELRVERDQLRSETIRWSKLQQKTVQSMERHRIYIEELIYEKKELWCECSHLQVEAEAKSIQYLKKAIVAYAALRESNKIYGRPWTSSNC